MNNDTSAEYDRDDRDVVASVSPRGFERRFATFSALDPEFTRLWLNHVGTLFARKQLDTRTRVLVLTGQFTMRGNMEALEDTVEVALREDVDPQEVLEVILQCYVYAGQGPVGDAAEVFLKVLERAGRKEEFDRTRRSPRAAEADRDLETEREGWTDADRDHPDRERLFDTYGWGGISTGLRLRPGHHINLVKTLDALDPEFLQTWLDSVYQGMYTRGILDDRTRLLCVVGNTFAVGEGYQSRRHMRAALREGADPRDLLELIFQTTAVFGHPHMLPLAVDDLLTILDSEGRLHELLGEDHIDEQRAVVKARIARRGGVEEMPTHVQGT
jgi:alkylhydroperoxidase/carboxymuconolactone decarboxylase family protein YurZ